MPAKIALVSQFERLVKGKGAFGGIRPGKRAAAEDVLGFEGKNGIRPQAGLQSFGLASAYFLGIDIQLGIVEQRLSKGLPQSQRTLFNVGSWF
jgi:hypothetical protein